MSDYYSDTDSDGSNYTWNQMAKKRTVAKTPEEERQECVDSWSAQALVDPPTNDNTAWLPPSIDGFRFANFPGACAFHCGLEDDLEHTPPDVKQFFGILSGSHLHRVNQYRLGFHTDEEPATYNTDRVGVCIPFFFNSGLFDCYTTWIQFSYRSMNWFEDSSRVIQTEPFEFEGDGGLIQTTQMSLQTKRRLIDTRTFYQTKVKLQFFSGLSLGISDIPIGGEILTPLGPGPSVFDPYYVNPAADITLHKNVNFPDNMPNGWGHLRITIDGFQGGGFILDGFNVPFPANFTFAQYSNPNPRPNQSLVLGNIATSGNQDDYGQSFKKNTGGVTGFFDIPQESNVLYQTPNTPSGQAQIVGIERIPNNLFADLPSVGGIGGLVSPVNIGVTGDGTIQIVDPTFGVLNEIATNSVALNQRTFIQPPATPSLPNELRTRSDSSLHVMQTQLIGITTTASLIENAPFLRDLEGQYQQAEYIERGWKPGIIGGRRPTTGDEDYNEDGCFEPDPETGGIAT